MLRLALIGAGRWGTNIRKTLEAIGGVELIVLRKGDDLDPTSPRLRGASGVLIATPGSTHTQIALPFIERGIPTFIEKPMATNLKDALKLENTAKKSKASVMVGHIHLYNPAYLKAKDLIGKAGNIRSLSFEGMNNGPYRDDMSALWDWTPHDVSMAIDVMGEMPKSVQAWGQKILRPRTDLYDTVTVRLVFSKEVEATIHNSWLAPEKRKKMSVVCAKDSIVYDDVQSDNKISLYKGMKPDVRGKSVEWHEPSISHPTYGKMSPLEAEMRAFLKMVRSGKKPVTDLESALDVTRILDAAERSMKVDGKAVEC